MLRSMGRWMVSLCACASIAAAQEVDETFPLEEPVAPVRAYDMAVDETVAGGFVDPWYHNGSVMAAAQTVVADVRCNGTNLQLAALTLDDDGRDNLFIKVQQQGGVGRFTHVGFYHGNGTGGWPNMTGGPAFFALDAQFVSAKMTVIYNGAGSVTLRFTEIDGGGGVQQYARGGWADRGGTGQGFGGLAGIASIDNWGRAIGDVCDNFERPNGPLGSSWVVVTGSASIVDKTARASQGFTRYVGNCASDPQTVEADIRVVGSALQYGALMVDGNNNNNLFVKVQQQNGNGRFTHVGFYQGNNDTEGWGGMTGGPAFFTLDDQFVSAHMTVIHNGFGDVTLVLSNIDGGRGRQIYERGGWAPLDGTRAGFGGFSGTTIIDNWGAGGGLVCDNFNRRNGPLGGNWQTTDAEAAIVSLAARGGAPDNLRSRSWFVGECGSCADDTPPTVTMTAPAPESCACGVVQVTGTVADSDGDYDGDTLEYRRTDQPNWTLIGSNPNERSGVLYNWNTAGLPAGLYFLRLTANNACGLSNTAVTIVYIDREFSPIDLRAPQNGNIVAGTACFDGTVWDRCFDHYVVEYQPSGGGPFNPVDPNNPVYNSAVINDPLAQWNTSGRPDGNYNVRVTAEDICGNTDAESRVVTVDNTVPVADITAPGECACYEGVVQVTGTANDANLAGWSLSYTGGDAHNWVVIASGNSPVINGVLANWNTNGLRPCAYTLRLTVADKASINCSGDPHVREEYISLNVGNCGGQQCTGQESLRAKCTRTGKIKATASNGVPNQPVSFFLNDGQQKDTTFNSNGVAKASWNGNPPGQHAVRADLACGESLNKNPTCR